MGLAKYLADSHFSALSAKKAKTFIKLQEKDYVLCMEYEIPRFKKKNKNLESH